MSDNNLNITISSKLASGFGSAFTNASKQVRGVRDDIIDLRKQQGLIKKFEMNMGSAGKARKRLSELKQTVKDLQYEIEKKKKLGINTKSAGIELGRTIKRLEKVETTVANANKKLSNSKKALEGAGLSAKNTAKQYEGLTKKVDGLANAYSRLNKKAAKNQQIQSKMSDLKSSAFNTTTKVAGGAVLALPALNFEKAASVLQAKSAEMTLKQKAMLEEVARNLGKQMQFTATQAVEGMTFLSMAGFSPKEIRDASGSMLELASAAGMAISQSADISSNILSGFGFKASEMTHVADVLSTTFTSSNVSLEQLGETMKYVGPIASKAGVSLEQAAAMAGMLGDVGIQGAQAGTTLRSALIRLAAPPKKAAEQLNSLGISIKDAAGNMRDVPTVLQEMNKAMGNMGNAEKLKAISEIFGVEAASGMTELVNNADTLSTKYTNILENAAGKTALISKTMNDNAMGALGRLGSGLSDIAITVGSKFLPAFTTAIEGITSFVNKLGLFLESHPKITTGLTVMASAFVGLSAAVLVVKFSALLGALAGVSTALTIVAGGIKAIGMALVANPIGLAVAAIAGSAALIYANWDKVAPYFKEIWTNIKGDWSQVTRFFSEVWTNIKGDAVAALNGIKSAWSTTKSFFSKVWSGVKSAFSTGVELTKKALLNFTPLGLIYKHWDKITGYFSKKWKDVKSGFSTGVSLVKKIIENFTPAGLIYKHWDKITGYFSKKWKDVKNGFSTGVSLVKKIIKNFTPAGLIYKHWDKITGYFKKLWKGVIDSSKSLWNDLKNGWSTLWSGFKSIVTTIGNNIKSSISSVWSNVKDTSNAIWGTLKSGWSTLWQGIGNTLSSAKSSIVNVVRNLWDSMISTFSSIPAKFIAFGKNIADGVKNGIKNKIASVTASVKNMADSMISTFKNLPAKFKEFGKNIADGVKNGIKNKIASVTSSVGSMAEGVKSKFKSLLGIKSPSRIFAGYGGDIMSGLGNGIEDGREGVVSKFDGLFNSVAKGFSNFATEVSKTITEGFVDAALNGTNSFKDMGANLKNMFKDMVLRPVIQAVMAPISGAIGGILNPGTAATGAGGISGIAGMIGGAKNLIFGNSLGAGISSAGQMLGTNAFAGAAGVSNLAFGGAGLLGGLFGDKVFGGKGGTGGSIGSTLGMALGGPLGALAGSVLGGFIGGLFGGKKADPGLEIGGLQAVKDNGKGYYGSTNFNVGKGQKYSAFRDSAFGQFGLVGGRGHTDVLGRGDDKRVENVMKWMDSIVVVDDTIASFISNAEASKIRDALQNDAYNSLSLEDQTTHRLKTIFENINSTTSSLVNLSAPIESVIDRIVEIGSVSQNSVPLLESFGFELGNSSEQALSTAVTWGDALKTEGETLAGALQRNAVQFKTVSDAALLLDLKFNAVGLSGLKFSDSLITIMGGLDAFNTATSNYYENFYSKLEKQQISLAASAAQLVKFNEDLGKTDAAVIDSKQEFRNYVEALDLTTQAGQEAFKNAMDVQQSLLNVADSGSTLNATVANLPEGMLNTAQAMLGTADKTEQASNKASDSLSGVSTSLFSLADSANSAAGQISAAANTAASAANDAQAAASRATTSSTNAANAASDAASQAQSAANAATDAASQISNVASSVATAPSANDGSFFTGLFSVPRDNFRSNLHRDEMVLPAKQANALRAGVALKLVGGSRNIQSIKQEDSAASQRAHAILGTDGGSSSVSNNQSTTTVSAPITQHITITVNAAEGMDTSEVAQQVRHQLELAKLEADREQRGFLHDGRRVA